MPPTENRHELPGQPNISEKRKNPELAYRVAIKAINPIAIKRQNFSQM